MTDEVETIAAAAARLLRVLDERAARRRRGIVAPPIAPTAAQLQFNLACPEAMKSRAR